MKIKVFIVTLFGVLITARSSIVSSDIIIHGNQQFRNQVNAALTKFIEASPELRQIIEGLQNSSRQHIVNHNTNGTLRTEPHNQPNGTSPESGGNGSGSSSTVQWDPTITDPLGEGINDACVTLIHEFRHSFDLDRGVIDTRDTDGNGIMDAEESASRTENAYRRSAGLGQRLNYNGSPLPGWAHF